jgi:predicted ATPase
MLISLRLKNFKSFADQTVELSPLTLLLGANASGKSNFLDAIRFLQGMGLDLPLSDVFRGRIEGGREIWPGLRGSAEEAARGGAKSFTIESRWALGREELVHSITCRVEPEPAVEHESLQATGLGFLFDTPASALKGWELLAPTSSVKSGSRRGRGLRASAVPGDPARRSLLGQIEHHHGKSQDVRLNDVVERCHALQMAMRGVLSLDLTPARMRSYVHRSIDHLGTNGENLSAAVFRLCQDADRKIELMGWLSALCAPDIADIDFVETELSDVMMRIVEKDGTRISARSLSDGALRVLGKIVAVLTAPEGSLLLLEELEHSLHPAQAGLLIQILEAATLSGACQILATTHSPALLRAMSKEALRRAVVFGRHAGTPGTAARRLGSLPHLDEVLQKGVEHLFATRWLEM